METDKDTILKKVLHYCAYQDRCLSEVRMKLSTFELPDSEKRDILKLLQDEGFIDDERYVRTFVKSKFHLKKWGVKKIAMSLKMKGIDSDLIREALGEVDEDTYREALITLLKSKKINESDPFKRKAKLAQYAMGKGYEAKLVWEVIALLFPR